MDHSDGMRVLLALSEGAAVSHAEMVGAGRIAARVVMASQGSTVLYSDEPWFGVWELDRLSDEEAASLARRFAAKLTEFRSTLAE